MHLVPYGGEDESEAERRTSTACQTARAVGTATDVEDQRKAELEERERRKADGTRIKIGAERDGPMEDDGEMHLHSKRYVNWMKNPDSLTGAQPRSFEEWKGDQLADSQSKRHTNWSKEPVQKADRRSGWP